jgi:hypothetical protein
MEGHRDVRLRARPPVHPTTPFAFLSARLYKGQPYHLSDPLAVHSYRW